jgi:uncharacterized membrane protein
MKKLRASVAGLLLGAGLSLACQKNAVDSARLDGRPIKQSLATLRPQFAELRNRFADIRRRVESISPDVPGFAEARAGFYAAEEARGVAEARIEFLSNRLDAAVSSGNRDELQEVAKEIASSSEDIRKIDGLHTKLSHEMIAFEQIARQQR